MSLENIVIDVNDLEKNMEGVKKEAEVRKGTNPSVLKDFLHNSEDKLRKLKADCKVAQESFTECVEFFGESGRTTNATTFFSMLVRFVRAFKVINLPFYLFFLHFKQIEQLTFELDLLLL